MTLQQLRYAICVAQCRSITAAASVLYMRQPSLSKAISELEHELGVVIFERSPHGVDVTAEGDRFLAYARQVVEQADLLEGHYVGTMGHRRALCISCPHNLLMTQAFAEVAQDLGDQRYELTLREVPPAVVIEDVRQQRSELGAMFRSEGNRESVSEAVRRAGLRFAPFATIVPRALVAGTHPLAAHEEVAPHELAPYPRVMLEWVSLSHGSSSGALVSLPKASRIVRTTDRETQRRLVRLLDGYMLFLPIRSEVDAEQGFRALRIAGADPVELGLVTRPGFPLSPEAEALRQRLERLGS